MDLFNVGDYAGAAAEYSKAIDAAPHFANEQLALRAMCYAVLAEEEKMLNDVQKVLKNAQSDGTPFIIEPRHLSQCALSVALYIWGKEDTIDAEKRKWYLEQMKLLLTESRRRCTSGVPYTLEQLDLDTEYFRVLRDYDPAFWDDYVKRVSLQR
jgi:tetratricopeptide (TPR) repeat protein